MKKLFLFGFLFIMLIGLVSAVSPFIQESSLSSGLTLQSYNQLEHDINTEYYLHSHIYNTTNGLLINGSLLTCEYHLYSENINWEHLTTGYLESYGDGMFTRINETYFNETGLYNILLWCNTSLTGGYTAFNFEVIDENYKSVQLWTCPSETQNYAPILIILGLSIIFMIIALVIKENLIGVFGALILTLSYLFIGACAPILFMFIPVVGILLTLWFALS